MQTIITKVENNRVVKFLDVSAENANEVLSSVIESYPDAFIYDGNYRPDLWVEGADVSIMPINESGEQIIARLESAIDRYLDAQANSFRYESIRTMVTYVGDPNSQFNAEGVGALNFRSNCYTLALMIISEVQQGRPVPTEEELFAEMPKLADFVIY